MNEAEVCTKFKTLMEKIGWIVYPETSNWDLLCVGHEGIQIGIEAKGRANVQVLHQALHGDCFPGYRHQGPDFHAVLVPECAPEFRTIANQLKLLCFDLKYAENNTEHFFMRLSDLSYDNSRCWNHIKPCWTPPFKVEVPAGVPSPERVTPWKINAVKVCLRLEEQGYVTTRDFREFGVSFSQYWRHKLRNYGRTQVPNLKGGGSVWVMRYVQSPGSILPSVEYPEILAGLRKIQSTVSKAA